MVPAEPPFKMWLDLRHAAI